METTEQNKTRMWKAGIILGASLSLLALVTAVGEVKSWKHLSNQGATISVSGEGTVTMVPDIAEVSFTVRQLAKTVPEAQKAAEAKLAQAVEALKKQNIEDKDIKTTSYSISPKYTYNQIYCITTPCPTPKQELEGYEVVQSVSVKVRNPDRAGEVLAAIGGLSITEVYGPNFTVDDMEGVRAHAEELAIQEAKAKAKKTARSLGVSLGEIVSYSNDAGAGYPMFYRDTKLMSAAANAAPEAVTIPAGENEIKVRVTITYELR